MLFLKGSDVAWQNAPILLRTADINSRFAASFLINIASSPDDNLQKGFPFNLNSYALPMKVFPLEVLLVNLNEA